MKILVLGCNGQLGRCLNDQLANSEHDVVFSSREQIDIADLEQTKKKISYISPDVVINASAYTNVDKAEEEQKIVELINHYAVANIAKTCSLLNIWLIHISTDYVFDGNSKHPYKENDKTNPLSFYGNTKLKGEEAIQLSGCKYIIIRAAWVFSEYGTNFLKTMLSLGGQRNELSIVGDQVGCPTYAQDIAGSIVKILPQLDLHKKSGLYHYCGDKSCSWYEFAQKIFYYAESNNLKTPSQLNKIETFAYPMPAKRPAFSVLDCCKIKNDFGILPSNWQKGISDVIKKIKIKND
jgi:dTDP-4-dehydrorhamnose reductase